MQANIIPENIVFNNCYSGTEFENKTVDFLRLAGLTRSEEHTSELQSQR